MDGVALIGKGEFCFSNSYWYAHLVQLVDPVIQIGFAAVVEKGGNSQSQQVLSIQPLEEVVFKDAEPATFRAFQPFICDQNIFSQRWRR